METARYIAHEQRTKTPPAVKETPKRCGFQPWLSGGTFLFMTYIFESRREIVLEAHDKGILFTDTEKDQPPDKECAIFFEWDRVPALIDTLKSMDSRWRSKE